MLLLVTVGLVFAGLILLIVGFVQDSLTLIYLSIACAAIAGLALIVFSRLSRRRVVAGAHEGVPAAAAPAPSGLIPAGVAAGPVERGIARPAPAPQPPVVGRAGGEPHRDVPPYAEPAASEREPVVPDAADFDPGEPTTPQPVRAIDPEPLRAPEPARPAAAAGGWGDDEAWQEEDWGDEVVFPIEDYDELRVAEIVPLLVELDPDELEEVRDREAAGKARATILARIDELLGVTAQPAPARPVRKAAPSKAAAETRRAAAAGTGAAKAAKAAAGRAAARPAAKSTPARTPAKAPAAAAKSPSGTAKAPAGAAKATAKKASPAKAPAAEAPAARKAAVPKKAATEAAPAKGAATKKAAAKKAPPAKTTPPRKRSGQ